jgi:hypothetical protein
MAIEEIEKIMLECKNKGLNSREILQLMEVPCDCTDGSYLFDFGTMPVEELSEYIDYILRKRWYLLEIGTPVDGIYHKSKRVPYIGFGRNNFIDVKCRCKVYIYPSGEKTNLEISMPYKEDSKIQKLLFEMRVKKINETRLTESHEIVDQIKFLKPSIQGYLICNKCGAYYELHNEESPEDFPDKCECGGTFEYIAGPKQLDEKLVERKKIAGPTEYLRAPVAIVLVSIACLTGFTYNIINFPIGLLGLMFGTGILLMRHRSQELVLDMIYRRLIYLLAAVILLVASWGLITVLIQINIFSVTMLEFSLFTIIAVIFGLGMIFKTVSPDDSRNFLDPPL